MTNQSCTNELCMNKQTQLRLAQLREELLTNFNALLIERIRFLEQTINQLIISTSTSSPSVIPDKYLSPIVGTTNRLTPPLSLRRSSSANAYFLQSPSSPTLIETGNAPRSCPSSVDLSNTIEQQKWLLSIQKPSRKPQRTSSDVGNNYLCIPIQKQWASSTNDLVSSTNINNDKSRLGSRRFACDVDDNDVRAFKAMIYMEQARKQHARPLTRLRQALGISSNSNNTGTFSSNSLKKQSNL